MVALLSAQKTLAGRSGAGGIEEQPHQDGVMSNILQNGFSEDPGAPRESTDRRLVDTLGLNNGPDGD